MAQTQTRQDIDLAAIEAERARIRMTYLREGADRAPTTARGVHHVALLCADVERTVRFYQELLEFPLTDIFENRDYRGSNHFFFDIGHGNTIAFFDFPGLDLGEYREVLGGLHHLAISMEAAQWERIKAKLDAADIAYQEVSGKSLYFRDPDGTRLELTRTLLGETSRSRVR
jgi:catechol 2,3-dioxygenase-like lactoylglutathione lyase family enzyme